MIIYNVEIVQLLRQNDSSVENCAQILENREEGRMLSDGERQNLMTRILNIHKLYLKKWESSKVSRKWEKFSQIHKEWLQENFEVKTSCVRVQKIPRSNGRPSSSYDNCVPRSKRRKINHILENNENSSNLLLSAAKKCLMADKDYCQAKILNNVMKKEDKKELLQKIENKAVRPMTPIDALALMMDANLTVEQYNKIRNAVHRQGCKILPTYKEVAAEKKKTYPANLTVTPISAHVPWKDLIQHTLERLILSKHDEFEEKISSLDGAIGVNFIMSIGMDGSGSQAKFNQDINENENEKSLFVNATIPLRLVTSDDSTIIWTNPTPQSTRFCRTQKMAFQKETCKSIQNEHKEMMKELEELDSFNFTLKSGKKIRFIF